MQIYYANLYGNEVPIKEQTGDRMIRRRRRVKLMEMLHEAILGHQEAKGLYKDARGKPHLKSGRHLSISHCAHISAVVYSEHSPIGLDVQRFGDRHLKSFNTYFKTNLAPRDAAKIWVRMEAISKFFGCGLTEGLNHLFDLAVKDTDTQTRPFRISTTEFAGLSCAVCVSASHPDFILQPLQWQGYRTDAVS